MSEAVATSPKKSLMPMLATVIVVAALAGGGAWYYVQQQTAKLQAASTVQPAQYHKLDPSLVVNINDRGNLRYLQVELQVMARDAEVFGTLDAHAPVVRDALLTLFGRYPYAQLISPEGREELRVEALDAIRAALPDPVQAATIEALYFTSFVVQ